MSVRSCSERLRTSQLRARVFPSEPGGVGASQVFLVEPRRSGGAEGAGRRQPGRAGFPPPGGLVVSPAPSSWRSPWPPCAVMSPGPTRPSPERTGVLRAHRGAPRSGRGRPPALPSLTHPFQNAPPHCKAVTTGGGKRTLERKAGGKAGSGRTVDGRGPVPHAGFPLARRRQ